MKVHFHSKQIATLVVVGISLSVIFKQIDLDFWLNCNSLIRKVPLGARYNIVTEIAWLMGIFNVIVPYVILASEKIDMAEQKHNVCPEQLSFLLSYIFLFLIGGSFNLFFVFVFNWSLQGII